MRVLCFMALLVTVGCGGSPTEVVPEGAEALGLVKAMLEEFAKVKKRPPVAIAELKELEASHPGAYRSIVFSKCTILWKTPLVAGGKKVVAYCPPLPGGTGQVLMQDGTIREMTGDEFRKDPLAAAPAPG